MSSFSALAAICAILEQLFSAMAAEPLFYIKNLILLRALLQHCAERDWVTKWIWLFLI
jgi:hypothetical protein